MRTFLKLHLRNVFCIALFSLLFCSKTSAQTTLAAGDIAFVGYITADDGVDGTAQDDEFAFLLLKDVTAGTVINFTDFGWLSTAAFQTANPCGANTGAINDGIIRWTAAGNLSCGTQIRIRSKYTLQASSGAVTGIQACFNDPASYLSLSIGGDQLFAYQGAHATPTLLAGISINKAWDASLTSCFFSSNSSVLPAALGAGTNNPAITAAINGKYNCIVTNEDPSVLIPAINNGANWNKDNTFVSPIPVGFALPLTCSFSCSAGPSITVGSVSGTITACLGNASVSPEVQSFTASGTSLTNDILITAPANFEVSTTAGSGYGATVTLTQVAGTVAATTIYVRSAASAPAGPISGNITLSSAGATDKTVAVAGTVNAIPDAVATPAAQSLCSGSAITGIVLSGAVPGTTFNWTRDNTVTIGGSIGASGSGNISGTLSNTGALPVTVTFTITPVANGCTGTPVTATVTVNPRPTATITGGGLTVCGNAAPVLSANTDPNYTYSWEKSYLSTPFTSVGTGDTYTVTSSGFYRLTTTNQYGCATQSTPTPMNVADYVFNGSLGAGDAQQTGRLNRFAVISTCAAPKACPGTFTTTGSRYYDAYTITNPTNAAACAIIGLNSSCGTNVFSAAYLGSYNPTSLCTNYLADPGSSPATSIFYETTIPANGTIVVVVHEVNPGVGCGAYSLSVNLPGAQGAVTATPSTINCGGSSILTASPAASYLWENGNTTNSITVSPLITTTYSVQLGVGNQGCTGTASATVTVASLPPTITCPANIALSNTTGQCGRVVTYTETSGGTPAPAITYAFTGATAGSGAGNGSGSFFNIGTTTVTLTATNSCGTSSCSFTVTISDTEAPVITCPAAVTVSCAAAVPAVNIAGVVASDNCPSFTVTHTGDVISAQTCTNRYTITRTYRVTDGAGNFAECTQIITVNDQTAPVITCPAALTVSCASAVPAANITLVTATDNCGGAVTITHVGDVISGQTCANRYTITRTYRATDACGNFAECTQIITVNDQTAPVITCPAALTVSCASAVPAADISLITATDNCAGTITITHVGDVISGQTCANRYTITRTYRATDACGNFAECTQIITVNDQTAPVITCPVALTVSCASAVPAANIALVTATDNCGGAVTITHVGDVISGQTCANRYTITRTYRATDACGNFAECTQTITVNDQTAPVITCPAALTVSCASAVPAANIALVTATDNCGGAVTITHVGDVISGQTCANRYTITRTYRATDACGNFAECTQTITVNDQTAPVITCPAALTVSCASAVPAANIALVTATDNCGGAVTITHVGDVISGQTCANRYTITRTYRATDACGNFAECTQTITVNDQTAPVLTCPSNITVSTPAGSCTAVVNFTPTATDNCNGAVTIVSVPASGSVFAIGTTVVNVTATDACGNSSTCSFTVTVTDGQLPVISQQPVNRVVCAGTNATFSVAATNAVSYQWQQWNGSAWVNIAGQTAATFTVNNAAFSQNTSTYRVAVIGRCTTIQSAAASLYVNPLPLVQVSASISPALQPGQVLNLTSVVSPAGGTYSWLLNGSPLAGQQAASITGITVDGQGTYKLVYTDPNGCTSSSADVLVSAGQSNNIWVYPNPNTGNFNLRFYNTPGEKVMVSVFDAKGARVYQREYTTIAPYTNMPVNLSAMGMADGVYTVMVNGLNGKLIGSKRIVVYKN